MINILKYNDEEGKKLIEGLLSRSQLEYGDVQEKVNAIIADIKANGDKALFEYTKKFDKLTEFSIDDFFANVVPTATNIEVLMESRLSNNLVTLTAPVNKDAKNLFKWPNNFAWTYNG